MDSTHTSSNTHSPYSLIDHVRKIIDSNCREGVNHFKKSIKSYIVFHATALSVVLLEIVAVLILLKFITLSALFSALLALFFLTGFTYLTLIFYFQAKKPEQFRQIKHWFIVSCKRSFPSKLSERETHLLTSQALSLFANAFQLKDLDLYSHLTPLPSLKKLSRKLAYFLHWKDFLHMKEVILQVCIHEELSLLKEEPTDLEVHASLANSYFAISQVYKSIRKFQDSHLLENFSLDDLSSDMKTKFEKAMLCAIEEYKIIHEYTPNDPWAIAQLATCYHELEMFDMEIKHFERILEISDPNPEIMARLAHLYFQEGKHSLGFKLYQVLKSQGYDDASYLLDYYISKSQNAFSYIQ